MKNYTHSVSPALQQIKRLGVVRLCSMQEPKAVESKQNHESADPCTAKIEKTDIKPANLQKSIKNEPKAPENEPLNETKTGQLTFF